MLLQVVALVARTEVWNVCVRATSATVTRRRLFRAAGVGCLASGLNESLGNGGADRFSAPRRPACQSAWPSAAGAGAYTHRLLAGRLAVSPEVTVAPTHA
jgi:hypothetical protein